MLLLPAQHRAWILRVSRLCSFVLVFACSAPPPRVPLPSTAPPRAARRVWPRFREVQSWPTVAEPFANTGHVGAGERAFVRVSPDARPTYEHLVRDSVLPEGSIVALFHLDAAQRPMSVYVMEKSSGAWRFLALDSDGAEQLGVAPSGQATDSCRNCHADGVADSLFGVPRGAPAQP